MTFSSLSRPLALLFVILFAAHLVSGQEVVKAPPLNDSFANRLQINTYPFSTQINDVDEATNDPNDPPHPASCTSSNIPTVGEHSLWFQITLPFAGDISISTEQSFYDEDEDTIMTVYDVSLSPLLCNDDYSGDTYAAIVDETLDAGTYYIQVSSIDPVITGSFLIFEVDFTPDPTATPTTDPNITPTPTATVDVNATPTPTSTPGPTLTPTATNLIPFVELLTNRSFEDDNDNNGNVDDWVASGVSGDKRKCNKVDKVIAYDGICVYQFKGGAGENSKLVQDIDLTIPSPAAINGGDTLLLGGYFNGRGTVNAKVKVRITYTDSLLPRDKITGKASVVTEFTALSGNLSLILAGEPQLIRVQLVYKGTSGKVLFDLMSLQLNNTVAP
jgi:hypothetical protein